MRHDDHAVLWARIEALRPVIRAAQTESDRLRRLPDSVAEAFRRADIDRLILPQDLGGQGVDPLVQFDLIEEVSSYDGSAGWNFAIGSNGGVLAGVLHPNVLAKVFTAADGGVAVSGAPQGRAVAADGGYRISGRFAWASTIHQAAWVVAGCFALDGEEMRRDETNAPVQVQALIPKAQVEILDSWRVGGLKGTGSTEFAVSDLFVPDDHMFKLYGGAPWRPDPLYRLPPTFFGFGLCAVPLGIARSAVDGLKDLARRKKAPPGRLGLADQAFTQYVVAKAEALVEAGRISVRDAFADVWRQVNAGQDVTMESRARLRRASVNAAEVSVDAVQMCFRAAGGSGLFEQEPFERALRDATAAAGHVTLQRAMMEDAGRVAMGLAPLIPLF